MTDDSNIIVTVSFKKYSWRKSLSKKLVVNVLEAVDPMLTQEICENSQFPIEMQSFVHDKNLFENKILFTKILKLLDNKYDTLMTAYDMIFLRESNLRMKSMIYPVENVNRCNNRSMLRGKVYTMIYLTVKNYLGVRCFKHSSTLFRTYFESDPVFVTLCVNSKEHRNSWFSDILSFLSGLSVMDSSNAAVSALGNEYERATMTVSKISFEPLSKTVSCNINDLDVVISANRYWDLCLVSCFEEINDVIGYDSVFKAILCAIKKEILDIVYDKELTNEIVLLQRDLDLILMPLLLHYFCNNWRQNESVNYSVGAFFKYFTDFNWKHNILLPLFQIPEFSDLGYFEPAGYSASLIDICHAVDCQEKFQFDIPKIIQIMFEYCRRFKCSGLANRNAVLKKSKISIPNPVDWSLNLVDYVDAGVFQTVFDVFSRVDVSNIRFSERRTNFPSSNLQHLRDNIDYFGLVIYRIISTPPLLLLIKEILFERGPLPVGEIGKVLQQYTDNNEITQQLKDMYGGLKRLLQSHSADFLLSTSHPFNPKVYLQQLLTASDLRSIESGQQPTDYIKKCRNFQRKFLKPDNITKLHKSKKTKQIVSTGLSHNQRIGFTSKQPHYLDTLSITTNFGNISIDKLSGMKESRSMVDISSLSGQNIVKSRLTPTFDFLGESQSQSGTQDGIERNYVSDYPPGFGFKKARNVIGSSTTVSSMLYDKSEDTNSQIFQDNFF